MINLQSQPALYEEYCALIDQAQGAVTRHPADDVFAFVLNEPVESKTLQVEGQFSENVVLFLHRGAVENASIRVIALDRLNAVESACVVVGDISGSLILGLDGGRVSVIVGDCGLPFELTARCGDDGVVVIGDKTTIGEAHIMAARSEVRIGRDCMLSTGVSLISAQDHGIIELSPEGAELVTKRPRIELGDHVWMGHQSHCVGNAKLGSGSILAAHAVLPNSIPENSIGGGNPAKIIRTDRTWSRHFNDIEAETRAYISAIPPRGQSALSTEV